VSIVQGTALKI